MQRQLVRLHIAVLTLSRRQREDRGASLVEYAMLVAFIALACLSAVGYFGAETGGSLDDSSTSIITAN